MATWTTKELEELELLCGVDVSWTERARRLNRKHHQGRQVRTRAAMKDKALRMQYVQPKAEAYFGAATTTSDLRVEETPTSLSIQGVTREVRTLDDLVAHHEVDLTKWEATRFTCVKWDMGAKLDDGSLAAKALFKVHADFRPVTPVVAKLDQLRKDIIADIRTEGAAQVGQFGTIFVSEADVMLELGLPDLHLGKYAWAEETGNDYDTDIASALFKDAFESLLARASAFNPGKVLLPIGNDFFHIDNRSNQTTAGTPQDADTRYFKLIRRGRQLYSWAIKRCLDDIGPVQCVIVPGNHDTISTTFLGELLSAQFEQNPHVGLDESLYPRKYVKHGSVLLGYTHGNTEKQADLPLLMAQEQKHAWANASHCEWHIGHLHKSKETRITAGDSHHGGVRIRILPSLSGTDYWHATKGYTGEIRAAEAYLWSAGSGYLGHLNFSVRKEKEIPCIIV